MRTLVLGGTGFIGSAVVTELTAQGVPVTLLVHRRRPASVADVDTVDGSIATFSWDRLWPVPDVVIDCGRISGGSLRARAAKRVAAERLLRWTRRRRPRPFYVFVSGTLMYGSHGEAWISETTPLRPFSFARSNVSAETPWQKAVYDGEPVAIVRPPWVYGRGSWFESFYLEPFRDTCTVPRYGHGQQWLTLMSRKDCARMVVDVALSRERGVFNLVTHEPLRQAEFQELLCESWNADPCHVPYSGIEQRYGPSFAEALTFSARVRTLHTERWANYTPSVRDLRRGLTEVQ